MFFFEVHSDKMFHKAVKINVTIASKLDQNSVKAIKNYELLFHLFVSWFSLTRPSVEPRYRSVS